MSLAQTLWQEAQDAARRCLEHPFVQGLGDGSLPLDRYRTFIAQDTFYLHVFARAYAHCAATAPDREGLYTFHRLFNGTFDELQLHRSAAEELDIDLDHVEPIESTLAYTGFLDDCIHDNASTGITVASMTPCMRLYAYLGQELARGKIAAPYRAWVEAYATPDLEQQTQRLEELLDRYATPAGEREREQYHRAMELEYAFFDGAWRAREGNDA